MEEITDISVITFGDELLVEILGTDEDGEITVLTYEFEFADSGDSQVVHPKQGIESAYREVIEDALKENEIRLENP